MGRAQGIISKKPKVYHSKKIKKGGDYIGTISTQISIVDQMTTPLQSISTALTDVLSNLEDVNDVLSRGFNTAVFSETESSIESLNDKFLQLENIHLNIDTSYFDNALNSASAVISNVKSEFIDLFDVLKNNNELTFNFEDLNLATIASNNLSESFLNLQTSQIASNNLASDLNETFLNMSNNVSNLSDVFNESFSSNSFLAMEKSILNVGVILKDTFSGSIFAEMEKSILNAGVVLENTFSGDFFAEMEKNILNVSLMLDNMFESTNYITKIATVWQGFSDTALMSLSLISEKLNEFAYNESFNLFVLNASNSLDNLANITISTFELISTVGTVISNIWSLISVSIYEVINATSIYNATLLVLNTTESMCYELKLMLISATNMLTSQIIMLTTAQYALNASLYACPFNWVIMSIITIIIVMSSAIAMFASFGETAYIVTTYVANLLTAFGVHASNIFMVLAQSVLSYVNLMGNGFTQFANFLGNVFVSPLSAIVNQFASMASSVMSFLSSIASALDGVFGSNLSSAVRSFGSSVSSKAGGLIAGFSGANSLNLNVSVPNLASFGSFSYSAAPQIVIPSFEVEANLPSLSNSYENNNTFSIPASSSLTSSGINSYPVQGVSFDSGILNSIATNTGVMANSMNVGTEDLSYLREISSRDSINKFTTAKVDVSLGGITNNVASEVDLNSVVDYLARNVSSALEVVADGNYSMV